MNEVTLHESEAKLLSWLYSAHPERIVELDPDVFFIPIHRTLFDGFSDQMRAGQPLDYIVIAEKYGLNFRDVSAVFADGYEAGDWEYVVRDQYLIREFNRAVSEASTSHSGIDKTEQAIQVLQAALDKMTSRRDTVSSHDKLRGALTNGPSLVKTYIPSIDRWILGFESGDYVIIGGRPGEGKTALACTWAYNMAKYGRWRVDYHSYEMLDERVERRVVSNMASVDVMKFKDPKRLMTKEERDLCFSCIDELEKLPIRFKLSSGRNILQLASDIYRSDADVIIIDYIQKISADGKTANENDRLTQVSATIQEIGKTSGKRMIVLSQLNRGSKLDNRQPSEHDLRGSGSLEQDADIILLPYDEKAQDHKNREVHTVDMEMIGAKTKDSDNGSKPITFDKRYSRFYDPSEPYTGEEDAPF